MKKSETRELKTISPSRAFTVYVLLCIFSFVLVYTTNGKNMDMKEYILNTYLGIFTVLIPSLLFIYLLISRYRKDINSLLSKISKVEKLYIVLSEVNHTIMKSSSREEIFREVCRIITSRGKFDFAWIGVFDTSTKGFKSVAFGSLSNLYVPDKIIGKFTRERAKIINKSRTLVSEDINVGFGLHSMASFPIKVKDKVVAMLNIYSSRSFFEDQEIRLLQELVDDISFGLEYLEKDKEITKLARAVEQTDDCILITDKRGVIEYVNRAFERITGYSFKEVAGKKANILKSGLHDEKFYKSLWDTINSGRSFRSVFINRKKNGEIFYMEQTITPIKDNKGDIVYFVSTGKDITQQRIMETQLNYLAYYDPVTALPNRSLFIDRINQSIARAKHTNRFIAVVIIDIDNFKAINDVIGHTGGDLLLKAIGNRLENAVRDGDTVARLGSDEFGIVLVDISKEEIIPEVIRKITNAFSEPFCIEGKSFLLTVSMGVSVFPQDGEDAETLIKNADVALSQAKEQKGNSYLFFKEDMNKIMFEVMMLRTHLNEALRNGSFQLYYQPIINLNNKKVEKVEALLRWKDKNLGNIAPCEFIPILEETGMIINVGEWVIKKACEQLRHWHSKGIDIGISVNLSAIQLHRPDFIKRMEVILEDTLCSPLKLTLEITESALMKNKEENIKKLETLKSMGFSVYIDDFGTGYSSLSYLKQIPVDSLKVAGSFMVGVPHDKDDVAIVKAVANLANSLGIGVIAEHVETKEQVEFLWEHNFNSAQGYYFSPPKPPEEIEKLIYHQMSI